MENTTAPVGILGGTFDPIHYGHLRLAQEIGEHARLAEVRFIPTGVPPHRARPHADSAHRLEMVRRATAGNPLFTVDDRELTRTGPAYTIDTLESLRYEYGEDRPLCVLVGADAFLELATWRRWHELFRFAHLIVAHRPGFPPESWPASMPEPLAREYAQRALGQLLAVHLAPAGGVAAHAIAALDISASNIRAALKKRSSPRYLLPDSVLDYIATNDLYSGDE